MTTDSLPGNQFWERMLLLFITPGRRYKHVTSLFDLKQKSNCKLPSRMHYSGRDHASIYLDCSQ
ncbi:hypothetical protein DITRI_Ditri19aG0127300 [Diplodiscus trichospermus]